MIVPSHWAEARRTRREGNRQATVRRFGWSETSAEEAQAMADRRADEALEKRWTAGRQVPAREPKVPYNGAEGVPIREEVIARHGETVLTRNSYGAVCLNTPNVLFVDMDHPNPDAPNCAVLLIPLVLGPVAWLLAKAPFWSALAGALVLAALLGWFVQRRRRTRLGDGRADLAGLSRVRKFHAARPDWRMRVYRTPVGLRVLALHRTFEPGDPAIAETFEALGADPAYRRMCERQRCFRARLTAKPWRIGLADRLRPRPGVWPVAPANLPQREAWVANYNRLAQGFAACAFVEELGTAAIAPAAAAVRDLHDTIARAESGLPLA